MRAKSKTLTIEKSEMKFVYNEEFSDFLGLMHRCLKSR